MKKTLLLLFAALMCMGGVNAGVKYSIGEPTNNTADGEDVWYDSSTKTITFFSQWNYRPGWWIGDKNYSDYETFVIKFSGTVSNKIQVLIEYTDTYIDTEDGNKEKHYASYGNNGDTHENTITVTLDGAHSSSVRQIYLQLADALGTGETASVTFSEAYFESSSDRTTLAFDPTTFNQHWDSETYDASTHVIQYNGSWKGIGWWLGKEYPEYKSAVFIFEKTTTAGQLVASCPKVGDEDPNSANKWFGTGSTYVVCDISGCTTINQFMLQNATENATITFKKAYFSTLDATSEEAYITSYAWPLIINSSGYASFASDNALDFSDVDGLEAYIVSSLTSTEATMKKVSQVPMWTGLILKGTAGTTYEVPIIASADPVDNWLGCTSSGGGTCESGQVYVLSDGQFKKYTGTEIPAYKAYLLAENIPAEAHELSLNFGDATGIKNIKVGTEDNVYYDLQGRRVLYPTKGLYIVNGKKVIVK